MSLGENKQITLYASGVRAASSSSGLQANRLCRGLELVVDITAVPGVQTVTFTIEGFDPASGKYYTILASTALAGTGTTIMRVYPGLVVAANLAANACLPLGWRLSTTHSGGSNFTYSVGGTLLV